MTCLLVRQVKTGFADHRYMTIVLCLETGAVIFAGDGKGREALNPFSERLKRLKARIEAVAIDMSPAYIAAVMESLPETTIVFDHFHVAKLYDDADILGKKLIKGTTRFLMMNP